MSMFKKYLVIKCGETHFARLGKGNSFCHRTIKNFYSDRNKSARIKFITNNTILADSVVWYYSYSKQQEG